jgi:hypothetical protein
MPAPLTQFPKVVEIVYVEEADTWMGYVYQPDDYERATEEKPPVAVDIFAALHETSLLSRIHEVYDTFEIKSTDGECKIFR